MGKKVKTSFDAFRALSCCSSLVRDLKLITDPMKSSEQVIMTFEPSDHQAQEIAHKKKLKRKKRKNEHKQQVSVVPDVDPVGNQPKNVVSPDSPRRDHEEKIKK